MKIVVYAIAKNESKHVEQWVKSMSEADEICVLDTGSTDDTVDKLKRLGVTVKVHNYSNGEFRFDNARNESMAMCPSDADLLVCTDLDETFSEGWRNEVERQWTEAIAKDARIVYAEYEYWHTLDESGNPIYKFNNFKIHRPKVAKWVYACHEILEYTSGKRGMFIKDIILKHHQDRTKPRSELYLSLLKKASEESPMDARASHYYGRELMYNDKYDEAIQEFTRHLSIHNGWNKERMQSMRYMARCYKEKGLLQDAYYWYTKAIAEDSTQREAAMELARLACEQKDWEVCAWASKNALMVLEKLPNYVTEESSWGGDPFYYYSLGLANKSPNEFFKAGVSASIALRINPDNLVYWRNMIALNGQSPLYPPIKEEVALIDEFESKCVQQSMPDWSIFDHVYCIHYLGNRNREEGMKREFSRVGLWGRENFSVYESVRTVYEEQLQNQNECAGIKNLALNTLKILIGAKMKGYKRILIFEDDVCFLKNIGIVSEVFKNTPTEYDLCVYDKMVFIHNREFQNHCNKKRINKYFSEWDKGIYSGSCYMVSDTAYDSLIELYSQKLIAPDDATQIETLKKAYSIINTSCQCAYEGCMFSKRFGGLNTKNGYAFQGLDYGRYNVPSGYGYDEYVKPEMCF